MVKRKRRRRSKFELGQSGSGKKKKGKRTLLGPALPDYGPVETAFHAKFAPRPGPTRIPSNSLGFRFKQRGGGGATNGVVTIKGRPIYLMDRNRKVVQRML